MQEQKEKAKELFQKLFKSIKSAQDLYEKLIQKEDKLKIKIEIEIEKLDLEIEQAKKDFRILLNAGSEKDKKDISIDTYQTIWRSLGRPDKTKMTDTFTTEDKTRNFLEALYKKVGTPDDFNRASALVKNALRNEITKLNNLRDQAIEYDVKKGEHEALKCASPEKQKTMVSENLNLLKYSSDQVKCEYVSGALRIARFPLQKEDMTNKHIKDLILDGFSQYIHIASPELQKEILGDEITTIVDRYTENKVLNGAHKELQNGSAELQNRIISDRVELLEFAYSEVQETYLKDHPEDLKHASVEIIAKLLKKSFEQSGFFNYDDKKNEVLNFANKGKYQHLFASLDLLEEFIGQEKYEKYCQYDG